MLRDIYPLLSDVMVKKVDEVQMQYAYWYRKGVLNIW